MTRHRRNEFSNDTKREAYRRSRGVCECHRIPHVFKEPCRRPLGQGNTFYEHIDPDKISGRNDIDNCAALTKTCQRFKTRAYDLPVIADNNRMQDRARGIHRSSQPMRFGRDDSIKLRMNAAPVYRDSGKPVLSRPWVKTI